MFGVSEEALAECDGQVMIPMMGMTQSLNVSVACAIVLGEAVSVYRWEGRVHEDAEVVMVAKTVADKLGAAVARVKELHGYECPCVVAVPIAGGNPDFLDWIGRETE